MDGYLSLQQAAAFLGLSRPTLNARRRERTFSEITDGPRTLLKKEELLELYAKERLVSPSLNLVVTENDKIDSLTADENTLDLRKINLIDAYGTMSLLVCCLDILERKKTLYLIVSDSNAISSLEVMGFFKELIRRFEGRVFWNESGFPTDGKKGSKAFLPIRYIAFKGQERKYLEDLVPLLNRQGFDDETIGYLSWFIGELADNSLTHAQGPCYVLLGQFSGKKTYLEIAIGDVGKGLFTSLKENPKYASLPDEIAFIKAFQSQVSCWPDDKPRGKGLSDVLALAMGSGSILRVDSKNRGLIFNFSSGQKELMDKKPSTPHGGARFCWVLINDEFKNEDRSSVDAFILREIEKRR